MKRLCSITIACILLVGSSVRLFSQEEKPDIVPDGPWITSVVWQAADELIGTRSQGLLFRPGEVVKSSVSAPNEFTVLGQAESALWSVVVTPAGQPIASDYKGGVHLFGGEQTKTFELTARWIRALCMTPTEGEMLAGTEDGKLIVLSIGDAKEIRRVDAHEAAIFDIAVSASGDKIATAGGDGSIKVFSWPALQPLASMQVGKDAIWSLTFVNNDAQIVSGGADRAIQLWDVAQAKSIVTIATAHNWVTSVVALPKSNLVACGCMDGQVVVVNHRKMIVVAREQGPSSAIWSMALSPDASQLAVATRKHGLAVMKVNPWRKAARAAVTEANAVKPPAPKKT